MTQVELTQDEIKFKEKMEKQKQAATQRTKALMRVLEKAPIDYIEKVVALINEVKTQHGIEVNAHQNVERLKNDYTKISEDVPANQRLSVDPLTIDEGDLTFILKVVEARRTINAVKASMQKAEHDARQGEIDVREWERRLIEMRG